MLKKISVLLTVLLVVSLASSVFAASDAFTTITVDDTIQYIDDDTTQDQGGSGNPIQFVDGYGCGYSSLNDIVVFSDLDFGTNGAKACSMKFGYAGASTTTLSVYVDDYKGTPAATLDIGNTGGWDIASVTTMTDFDITVPAGVHTIYFQFTNDQSGSISDITFIEGDPVIEEVVEEPAVEAPAAAETTAAPVAAQTSDAIVAVAALLVAASGAALVIAKKRG